MILFTAAGVGCALATGAGALIALRFFQGLGACAGTVCARAIVEDVATSRARSASLQAYVTAFNNVAPLVAPLLGAAVLTLLGWRWLYGVLAVAGVLLLAGVAFGIPETGPMVDDRAVVAYRRVLRLPRTAGLAGVSFFSFAAYFALITGSPFVLIGQLHVAPTAFSLAFAVNAAAALAGTFLTARLAKRIAPERILRGGVALAVGVGIATLLVDARAPSIAGFVTTFALYGLAFGVLVPVLYTAALAGVGADTGLAAGVLGAAQSFGGAAGSGLAGALPWPASTAVGAVVAAAALACGVSYACSRSEST